MDHWVRIQRWSVVVAAVTVRVGQVWRAAHVRVCDRGGGWLVPAEMRIGYSSVRAVHVQGTLLVAVAGLREPTDGVGGRQIY